MTENGTWSFSNFSTIAVDAGGNWTLNGGNIATVLDNGIINVTGSLTVSSAIDAASSGVFQLHHRRLPGCRRGAGHGNTDGIRGQQRTAGRQRIVLRHQRGHILLCRTIAGTIGSGDLVDLKQFGATGAALQFDTTTGILQLTNSAAQRASLAFQTSSLGSGTFHAVSDGSTGLLLTIA